MTKTFARNFTEIEFQNEEIKTAACCGRNLDLENNLCRPIVFCKYEAYEYCPFKPFSTCESCR